MSLLARVLMLVVLALVPAIAIQAWQEIDHRRGRLDDIRATTMRHAELFASEQTRIVDGARQLVAALAQVQSIRLLDSERCHDLLNRLVRQFPQYALMDAMDRDGNGRCAGQPGQRNNVSDRAWFRLARDGNAPAIGEYVFGKQSRKHSLHVSHPLHDGNGAVSGVVAAAIDLEWLDRHLNSRPFVPGMSAVVADRRGIVLAAKTDGGNWIGRPIPESYRPLLDATAPGTVETKDPDGRDAVVSFLPLRSEPADLLVAVSLDRAVAMADLATTTRHAAAAAVLGLALTVLCAWMLAHRFLLAPIGAVTAAIRRRRDGDPSARTGCRPGRDEFSTLGLAFDEMAEAAEAREVLRRQAEEALAESERRYRFLADSVPQIVWTATPDGALDFIGARLAEYVGSEDVRGCLGAGWAELLHPDDLPATAAGWADARREGREFEAEYRLRRHDGVYRWHLARAVPMRDRDGRVMTWFGSTMDIHDRQLQSAALAAARDEAERASQSKTRFLAAASHDLRQPMQSVILFAHALDRHVQDEAGKRKLAHLDRGLDAMKGLLDALLDVSRLEAGSVQANVEDLPLGPLVEHIGVCYQPIAAGRGLGFSIAADSGLTVRSDGVLLGRLLRNLIENALRYTERGGVEVVCVPLPGRIRIEVRDTGIGIPPEHLERIWEEFHQVGNPERDRQQGLGLGLAIVRRLAKLLGHGVGVRSEPGRGSVFSVELGLVDALAGAAPAASVLGGAPEGSPVVEGGGRLAVLVDDDAIVLSALEATLTEWGFDVLAAGSTDQALDRLTALARRPDIVIADYRLREGRVGTEAILKIRAMFGAAIPGIILTGEIGTGCRRDAAAHRLRVVQKPIQPCQLGRMIGKRLLPLSA